LTKLPRTADANLALSRAGQHNHHKRFEVTNLCELMTIPEVAAELGVPIKTVRHWRLNNYGPRSAKLGKRVVFRRSEVLAFLDSVFAEAI
jgi:predicted DNA-binding transcriptional regulator AlpA